MSAKRLKKSAGSTHAPFWANLKEGYDLFEKDHLLPDVTVTNGRYTFAAAELP
jgi:murein L,D-transpeptidase YafK